MFFVWIGKNVLMYCTGGVRCERASALLKSKYGDNVGEVYQLQVRLLFLPLLSLFFFFMKELRNYYHEPILFCVVHFLFH